LTAEKSTYVYMSDGYSVLDLGQNDENFAKMLNCTQMAFFIFPELIFNFILGKRPISVWSKKREVTNSSFREGFENINTRWLLYFDASGLKI